MDHDDRGRTALTPAEFSRRLDHLTRENQQQGDSPALPQALIARINLHCDRMLKRLKAAEANGTTWDVLKVELRRDFGALVDQISLVDEVNDERQNDGHHTGYASCHKRAFLQRCGTTQKFGLAMGAVFTAVLILNAISY
jgi:hypothetical protein